MSAGSVRLGAWLAMLTAALVWGATFVVVQRGLEQLPVFHLICFRFALGSVLLAPIALRSGIDGRVALRAAGLGAILFVAFALQTAGLLWTTPARSAFLTGLSVLLVPLFGWLLWRLPLSRRIGVGLVLATLGLLALFQDDLSSGVGLGPGETLTLLGAGAYALHILAIDRWVARGNVLQLATLQFAVVALLAVPSLWIQPVQKSEFHGPGWVAIVGTGVFATALAFTLQLYAQRHLSATETALLLALEPLFAAVFSIAAGAEAWTSALTLGGFLLIAGTLVAQGVFGARNPGTDAGESATDRLK